MTEKFNLSYLDTVENDTLYHLGLDSSNLECFASVKVVCLAGSQDRAQELAQKLKLLIDKDETPIKAAASCSRGEVYLVGDVISMSHGMGTPSCLIFLHEIVKLLYHAKADLPNIDFVRLGTCGGIGLPAGSMVITEESLDDTLIPGFEHTACGVKKRSPAVACKELNKELLDLAEVAVLGKTMTANNFYEAQARLDGAIQPWYTDADKLAFLNRAKDMGVKNIEMESSGFLSFFQRLGLRAAVICVTLLDRLSTDQIVLKKEEFKQFTDAPMDLIMRHIVIRLALK